MATFLLIFGVLLISGSLTYAVWLFGRVWMLQLRLLEVSAALAVDAKRNGRLKDERYLWVMQGIASLAACAPILHRYFFEDLNALRKDAPKVQSKRPDLEAYPAAQRAYSDASLICAEYMQGLSILHLFYLNPGHKLFQIAENMHDADIKAAGKKLRQASPSNRFFGRNDQIRQFLDYLKGSGGQHGHMA